MKTIKTPKSIKETLNGVFSKNWKEKFEDVYQNHGFIDLKDLVTLHTIAECLVKPIPYGLSDKESARRYKGNLTRFGNDETVSAILDKYPFVNFGVEYDDLFASSNFAQITWYSKY